MNLIHRLSPGFTPPSMKNEGDLLIMREKVLQAILIILCLFGIPAVALGTFEEASKGNYVISGLYISFYLLLVGLLLARNIPYEPRGAIVILFAYLLAVSELFSSGQLGEVRMFLVTFIVLTSVLFNYRVVLFAVLLSLATIIVPGIYASSTSDPIIPSLAGLRLGTSWFTSSVVFLMIASMVAGSISMIIAGLAKNLARQAELSRNLEIERSALEERVQERTHDITRRLVQLRTASEISRTISALSDPDILLNRVVELIKERFSLYYVGIFLLDASREYAVLQAGTGEAGRIMRLQSHRLSVGGSSMIGWSIANREPRIALDVGSEAIRFNNPHLPATRSELALPIIARDEVLGAMTIQSEQPNAFDENDIAVLASVADSLAIALENDRLFQETHHSLEEIRVLNREYLRRGWATTAEIYGELSFDYWNPLAPVKPGSGRTIQIPLTLRDEIIGQMDLEIDQDELTEDENNFIESITTQAAIALENARLLQETERRASQEQKLNELASRFSRALNIDEILRTAAQELGQLPAVTEVSVRLSVAERKPGIAAGQVSGSNGKEK